MNQQKFDQKQKLKNIVKSKLTLLLGKNRSKTYQKGNTFSQTSKNSQLVKTNSNNEFIQDKDEHTSKKNDQQRYKTLNNLLRQSILDKSQHDFQSKQKLSYYNERKKKLQQEKFRSQTQNDLTLQYSTLHQKTFNSSIYTQKENKFSNKSTYLMDLLEKEKISIQKEKLEKQEVTQIERDKNRLLKMTKLNEEEWKQQKEKEKKQRKYDQQIFLKNEPYLKEVQKMQNNDNHSILSIDSLPQKTMNLVNSITNNYKNHTINMHNSSFTEIMMKKQKQKQISITGGIQRRISQKKLNSNTSNKDLSKMKTSDIQVNTSQLFQEKNKYKIAYQNQNSPVKAKESQFLQQLEKSQILNFDQEQEDVIDKIKLKTKQKEKNKLLFLKLLDSTASIRSINMPENSGFSLRRRIPRRQKSIKINNFKDLSQPPVLDKKRSITMDLDLSSMLSNQNLRKHTNSVTNKEKPIINLFQKSQFNERKESNEDDESSSPKGQLAKNVQVFLKKKISQNEEYEKKIKSRKKIFNNKSNNNRKNTQEQLRKTQQELKNKKKSIQSKKNYNFQSSVVKYFHKHLNQEIKDSILKQYSHIENNDFYKIAYVIFQIIAIATDHNNMNLFTQSVFFLADLACEMNFLDESMFFYNECRKIAKKSGNMKKQIDAYIGLQKICCKKILFEDAQIYLKKGLQFAWYLEDTEKEYEIYEHFSQLFYLASDIQKSAEFYHRFRNELQESEDSAVKQLALYNMKDILKHQNQSSSSFNQLYFISLFVPLLTLDKFYFEKTTNEYQIDFDLETSDEEYESQNTAQNINNINNNNSFQSFQKKKHKKKDFSHLINDEKIPFGVKFRIKNDYRKNTFWKKFKFEQINQDILKDVEFERPMELPDQPVYMTIPEDLVDIKVKHNNPHAFGIPRCFEYGPSNFKIGKINQKGKQRSQTVFIDEKSSNGEVIININQSKYRDSLNKKVYYMKTEQKKRLADHHPCKNKFQYRMFLDNAYLNKNNIE